MVSYNSAFTGAGRHALAPNLGIGVDVPLSRYLALRFEARDFILHLPGPLRHTNHDLVPSAGLVLGLRTPSNNPEAFPRFEFHFEGGASFLTSGSSRGSSVTLFPTLGSPGVQAVFVNTSSFSATGRIAAGARIHMSRLNALEIGWSYSPTRYTFQQLTKPPVVTYKSRTETRYLDIGAVDYVRYFPRQVVSNPFWLRE